MCLRDGGRRQEQGEYRRSHERTDGHGEGRSVEACATDQTPQHAAAEAQACRME